LVAAIGTPVLHPAAVFAASGTVSQETPLYDSADPATPAIALLPTGTIVSIDGPPVDGFYPVTAGDQSGWMRGETLQVEKDLSESDAAAEMAVDAPRDQTDETVPADASADLDPARSTTVEPAGDPAVDTSAETDASTPVSVDATAPASAPAIAGDIAAAPTPVDEAVPEDASAPAVEGAAEPPSDANVSPVPVVEVAAVGPASVPVDAPILAGPGPEYGFIATAPAGSTVEQTGHAINGYATVQFAEVTGWLALDQLGAPGTAIEETPAAETAPAEAPLVDDPAAEPSLTVTTSSDKTPLAETAPPETPGEEPRSEEPSPPEAAPVNGESAEIEPVPTT
jgi:hypothetical protein